MASLASMLAGSAIGQGAANFVQGQARGESDRQRLNMNASEMEQKQKVWDFQNTEMDRAQQAQAIDSAVTDGATDADRLEQLAELAAKGNRGDLSRKYKAEATKAREAHQLTSIASASRAITLGQFQPAAQMLNQAGVFGQIHSIKMADDVEQDPRNPTYSVVTAGQPDAAGNPSPGPHVHVTQQMLYALQSKPGDALHWLTQAEAQGKKNELGDRRLDQNQQRLDETERHNRAVEAARRAGGAAGASGGRLTDQRWRYDWAKGQIGQPGGFASEKEAMTWATDPQKNSREYWAGLRLAGGLQNSGAIFTDPKSGQSNNKEVLDGLLAIVQALRGSPIGGGRLASLGAVPVKGREKEGVYQDAKGRHFKEEGGRILQWSASANKWVDVTDKIPGAR